MMDVVRKLRSAGDDRPLREGGGPAKLVLKATRYLARGRTAKALAVAAEGLSEFPHSDELRELWHFAQRALLADTIRTQRADLEKEPTLERHLALARSLAQAGEEVLAISTVETATKRFPDAADAHVLLGDFLMKRFWRDHTARDGVRGLSAYSKAATLTPESAALHLSLALQYEAIGAVAKAKDRVERALAAKPDHVEALTLKAKLDTLETDPAEEGSDDTQALCLRIEDCLDLEAEGAPGEGAERQESGSEEADDEIVFADLESLTSLGQEARAVFAAGKTMKAAAGGRRIAPEDEWPRDLATLATGFHRIVTITARRMGLGSFQYADLSMEDRRVHIAAAAHAVLAVESGGHVRALALGTEARRFIATHVRTRGGPGTCLRS